MGETKIGITKYQRAIAERYARRFKLTDHKVVMKRHHGRRSFYLIAMDENELEYRIRFDKVVKMKRPTGFQITNKKDYLQFQMEQVHGDIYDLSAIKDEDITFSNKLPIECKEHGVFYKRKSAFITDREGCPKCSRNRYMNNRKYYKK